MGRATPASTGSAGLPLPALGLPSKCWEAGGSVSLGRAAAGRDAAVQPPRPRDGPHPTRGVGWGLRSARAVWVVQPQKGLWQRSLCSSPLQGQGGKGLVTCACNYEKALPNADEHHPVLPTQHMRCHHTTATQPVPRCPPRLLASHIAHLTEAPCTIFSLLLAHASPFSLCLPMVEACLETRAGNGFSRALCAAFFVLGGFCGSSPQAGAARFRPVFAFLSQAFNAWPTLPPHPSRQQAS